MMSRNGRDDDLDARSVTTLGTVSSILSHHTHHPENKPDGTARDSNHSNANGKGQYPGMYGDEDSTGSLDERDRQMIYNYKPGMAPLPSEESSPDSTGSRARPRHSKGGRQAGSAAGKYAVISAQKSNVAEKSMMALQQYNPNLSRSSSKSSGKSSGKGKDGSSQGATDGSLVLLHCLSDYLIDLEARENVDASTANKSAKQRHGSHGDGGDDSADDMYIDGEGRLRKRKKQKSLKDRQRGRYVYTRTLTWLYVGVYAHAHAHVRMRMRSMFALVKEPSGGSRR